VAGVRVREEQVELAAAQLAVEPVQLGVQLRGQLGVVLGQLMELDEVPGPPLQPVPGLDLLPEVRRLAGVPAGLGGLVPDPGLGQQLLELG
jgi:hypothetical protein